MANSKSSGAAAQEEDISQLLGYLQKNIDTNEEKIMALKRFREQEKLPRIHRVPDVFHRMNERAYTPSVVAIGPLHRGKKHLEAMEGEKLSYMHFLFGRTRNFVQTGKNYVAAILELESSARACYADKCCEEKVRFAEMMLIDGCFMIEFFYRRCRKEIDPIVVNTFKYFAVKQDLFQLENQLPLVVLEELFRLTVKRIPEIPEPPSFTECVLSFFGDVLGLEDHGNLAIIDDMPSQHILYLLHSRYLPRQLAEEPPEREKLELLKNFKYSATELDLGGIKFVKGNNMHIFDLEFWSYHSFFGFHRRGQLKIPSFTVNDDTELYLRNFIAFEQSCHFVVKSYFTSHAIIMDKLVNAAEDVKLLEKRGIIVNNMGSREEVAHLFNNLCKNVAPLGLYSTKDCLEVIKFHKRSWPKFLVKLRRDYFSSPWAVISVIAAFILFILALMQTIFTARS